MAEEHAFDRVQKRDACRILGDPSTARVEILQFPEIGGGNSQLCQRWRRRSNSGIVQQRVDSGKFR
jgi:hypothetical protein